MLTRFARHGRSPAADRSACHSTWSRAERQRRRDENAIEVPAAVIDRLNEIVERHNKTR